MVLKINANITLGSLPGFHMVFICAYLLIQSPWQLRPVFYSPHVFHVPNVSHAMFFHFRPGVFVFSQCFPCFSIFPMFVFPINPKNLVHFCSVCFFSNRHVFSLMFPMFSTFCNHFLFSFWSHVSCIFQKRPKLFFICHFFQCFTTFVRWFFHCMFVFCFFPPGGQEEVHVGTATWWQAIFVSEEQRTHSMYMYVYIHTYIWHINIYIYVYYNLHIPIF